MKIPANYKKIINRALPDEWYCLGRRNGAFPLPIWAKFLTLVILKNEKLYKTRLPGIAVWYDSDIRFYVHAEEYKVVLDATTKLLFSFNKAKQHIKKVEYFANKAKDNAVFFKDNDLANIDGLELMARYSKVVDNYATSFMYGFISWCSIVLQDHSSVILGKYKKELQKSGIDEKTALSAMIMPKQISLYAEKEKAINKLAINYGEEIKKNKTFREVDITEKIPALHKEILKFLKRYRWVGYDYDGPATSYEEVIKAILEREPREKNKIKKKEIIKICGFSNSEIKFFEIFSLLSFVKDARNTCDDFVHFCLDFLYEEIGRRHNLTKKEVRYLWPEEFERLLKGEAKYNKAYLNRKMKYCAAITYHVAKNGMYFSSIESKEFIEGLLKLNEQNEGSEIKGLSASIGVVRARVKIIHSFKDLVKLDRGDVLVTPMTSPRFVNAMAKCAAIVTDEGGLTSHAAIIARELKKPCIVGTKNATRVLKDGDFVEVDADNGVVKILKKKQKAL